MEPMALYAHYLFDEVACHSVTAAARADVAGMFFRVIRCVGRGYGQA